MTAVAEAPSLRDDQAGEASGAAHVDDAQAEVARRSHFCSKSNKESPSAPFAACAEDAAEELTLNPRTIAESGLVVDDGARHAETVAHKDRMPNFDKNGLKACSDLVFTPEQKRLALSLVRPA